MDDISVVKNAGQGGLGEALRQMLSNLDPARDFWLRQPAVYAAVELLLQANMVSAVGAPLPGAATNAPMDVQCLRRAKDYIHLHIGRALTLGEIASHAHVSPRTLEAVFKRYAEQSPLAYARRLRIDGVHQVLCEAARQGRVLTVTEVALDHGFSHMGRFAAQYRRQFGCTPSSTLKRNSPGRVAEDVG